MASTSTTQRRLAHTHFLDHGQATIPNQDQTMKSPSPRSLGEDMSMRSPPPVEPLQVTHSNQPDIDMPSPHPARSMSTSMVADMPSMMSLIAPSVSGPTPLISANGHNQHLASMSTVAMVAAEMTNQDAPLIQHPYLDSLNLVVNAEFRFLVCQLCSNALDASTAKAHLRDKHATLLQAFNQAQFDQAVSDLGLATSLPTDLRGPRAVVHGLVTCPALACELCPTVMSKPKKMRDHHLHHHPNQPIPAGWRSCMAQRLQPEGAGAQRTFWEVIIAEEKDKTLAWQLLEEIKEELKVVQVPSDHRLISPWLRTTRWPEFVATQSLSIDKMRGYVAMPAPGEGSYQGLRGTIKQYYQAALTLIDTTDELVLQRLNSADPTKKGVSNTPFHRHMHASTLKEYILPVVSLVLLMLRVRWGGNADIQSHIAALQTMLEQQQGQELLIPQIHQLLLAMWTSHWAKSEAFPIVADPTEGVIALLTLNQDGSFKVAKDVTKIISKLEYCMRLTFLREIRAHANPLDTMAQSTACDSLQPWFTEKNYSTFARLRSLQHRASAIAYDTMGMPHIWWTETETWSALSYKGNPVAFADLHKMFQDIERSLVSTWEDRVLRGLGIRVDYDALADDLTNKDVGYSFLFDTRNACFQDRTRLVQAVVEGQGGFTNFLMQREGRVVWNRAALRGWLQDYAELQRLLLLRAQMLSGAPSRGTELTGMICCNTQTHPTCNLVVFGQHLTLLCQYSKTTALTGNERLIPHGLDAVTSDILIQDLAMARPFAQIAAKVLFDDPAITRLYKEMLFVNFNRTFTSEDLSAVMAKYSLPRINFSLTINPWHHIQTAWKRKFKCAVEDIVEVDEGEDVEALQAGHTRATENRIYGLSTQSLAGAAEDVLPLFLQASSSWQE
ncbi:hypothetical protein BKA82DRAFT_28410 [Pisolithus tinctorius]|uniref:C2H2-type domain-containing protein n=1 Tax=Pisolithus tinctorius Marx 270 TaxID=870435 RepID=A0A0C3JW41_PISTI|nr:hypothetical protein BKA82DRAFT_28410 [Pisolithus tinctorius]KIO01672.1 hypothetical protein M404DRAFT_28410 [Pisolithus tinctorius Marx 270]